MGRNDLFPRGFVIHRNLDLNGLPTDWVDLRLGSLGWSFSHDPHEATEFIRASSTDHWILVHGLCLYAGEDEQDLSPGGRLIQALTAGRESFLELLDLLGGRHIILAGDSTSFALYQDATDMRSVYFSADAELISSHAHLVAEIQEHAARIPDQGRNGCLKSWDRTPWLGVSGLLPNHELSVPDFSVTRFFPRAANAYRLWTMADRVNEYLALFRNQWRQFEARGFDPVLSITGGNDSRTNLALLSERAEGVRTFTYAASKDIKSAWADSTRLDRQIVEEIKECLPLDHRFFEVRAADRKSDKIPRAILARNTLGNHGSWLLPFYLSNFPEDNVIHIRGNTYGAYKAPWNAAEDNNHIDGLRALHRMLTRGDRGHEAPESREAHFMAGVRRWQYDGDLFGYHRNELLYWEMRLGRWASEIYNETDLAFPTFDPTNVRRMLEIALSFTLDEKRDKIFQSEVVNAAYPLLNFPGKNQSENLYEQTRDLLRSTPRTSGASGAGHHVLPSVQMPGTSGPSDQMMPATGNTPGIGPERVTVSKRYPEERNLPLQPGMTLLRNGEVVESVTVESPELYLPSTHFTSGTMSARVFEPSGARGSLTFTVESGYAKHAARDSWHYVISVDGSVRARWDGALRRRPVHVSVENITAVTTVEVSAVALRDRVGILSWEKATRARVSDAVFTKHDLPGPLSVSTDVSGSTVESTPEVLRISVDDLGLLNADGFIPEIPRRVDVVTSHCLIPLLVVRRSAADRTTIWCNGPVDLAQSNRGPVFQRSSWWPELAHHQIFVCDPATLGAAAVPIAWGQYSPEYWSVPDTSRAVTAISAALGVTDGGLRQYFGSSAGGFIALALASRDPAARVLMNNGQFDWTDGYPTAAKTVQSERLRNISLEALRSRTPERVDALSHWALCSEPPRVRYLVNTALRQDREISLPHVEKLLTNRPDLTDRIRCERYHDETVGSAPLDQGQILALLSEPVS